MRATYRTRATVRALLVGFTALSTSPTVLPAQEIEEILSYDVAISVASDGSMIVSEEITVRALGRQIRRGIYRDVPTSFPRKSGFGRIEAPFAMRSVHRDGEPEPFELSSIGTTLGRGGIRIRIGNPSVYLDPGVYTYTIEYETWRWVHFGDDHDELYWNVTGNGWGFPIRSASASVRVAGLGVEPTLEAWTGPEGSTARDAEGAWDAAAGVAAFLTTAELGPEEGMTVSVRFPKGIVAGPTPEQEAQWFQLDWGGYFDASYIVLLVVAVYLLMWTRVGRDPDKGHIVTQYRPPEGFSAAELGYLRDRGYDNSQLTAAIVSMAVKGAVIIEKDGKSWTLKKSDADAELTPEERHVFSTLLADRTEIELKQTNHETFRLAIKALKGKLSGRLERVYFLNNRGWFAIGVLVSVLGFSALAWRWRYGIEPAAWFVGLWLTGWSAGVSTMIWRATTDISLARKGAGAGHLLGGLAMGCFSIPFVGAWVLVSFFFVGMVPTHVLLAAVAIGVTNVVFYHLLERPTLKGTGVLNRLEGFERFLTATDGDRLDRTMDADRTPELFERYLPHAIALGVETAWARRFEWVLDPKGQMGSAQTFPWYHGGTTAMDATSFSASLGGSFTGTLGSSSSSPSSGSGGGGFSGGGGGGGGGGGW